jgi:adenylate kinase family enzyme
MMKEMPMNPHDTRPRIHLTGASCSGVSTLGSALSAHYGVGQFDVDDFYWMPTDPPFTTKRPPQDRVKLIQAQQRQSNGWVLTGSCMGWGNAMLGDVDLILFLHTPTAIRLQRLDAREAARYGARILPDGDMHVQHMAFRDWASRYDDPTFPGRNIAQHEDWLAEQSAPVLRLDGALPTAELMAQVTQALKNTM